MKTDDLPIFGVCGHGGSGKTTLIEQVIPLLKQRGLEVAVVKHAAHGIDVDRTGKDSDRFYRAGADVLLQGPGQNVHRVHQPHESDLLSVLLRLAQEYDLVLVEGHKRMALPKIWLLGDNETTVPANIAQVAAVLPRDSDRVTTVMTLLEEFVKERWSRTPVFGCVLAPCRTTSTESPWHLPQDERTSLSCAVQLMQRVCSRTVIATDTILGEVVGCPQLVNVPDAQGPMAGVLAAMRWAPHVSWLVAAYDFANLSGDALDWLVSTRAPGVWATLVRLPGSRNIEPALAHYDFRCRSVLQRQADEGNCQIARIAQHRKVISQCMPEPRRAPHPREWSTGPVAATQRTMPALPARR